MSGGAVQGCGDLEKLSLVLLGPPSRKEPQKKQKKTKKEEQKKNWNLMFEVNGVLDQAASGMGQIDPSKWVN